MQPLRGSTAAGEKTATVNEANCYIKHGAPAGLSGGYGPQGRFRWVVRNALGQAKATPAARARLFTFVVFPLNDTSPCESGFRPAAIGRS
jgi:hypothetical protein